MCPELHNTCRACESLMGSSNVGAVLCLPVDRDDAGCHQPVQGLKLLLVIVMVPSSLTPLDLFGADGGALAIKDELKL